LKKLNSRNNTEKDNAMLGYENYRRRRYGNELGEYDLQDEDEEDDEPEIQNQTFTNPYLSQNNGLPVRGIQIIINGNSLSNMNYDESSNEEQPTRREQKSFSNWERKSDNFEVLEDSGFTFNDVGGYDSVKRELQQCVDLLKNTSKYEKYNVRVPKGLILEGPPGNGKTLIAKALAGEAQVGFLAVSGSEFQEKYVGVGASRVRELFRLAKKNAPCIIFIDEIDALGRKRSNDGESSSNERDSTLNELLVSLDGFKNISGVFVVGATNRVDLLDPALMRPGRIDKKIFINNPDEKTRASIIDIHIKGKPHDISIVKEDMIELTNGLSGAQIENLLNEAMLNALRDNRESFTNVDVDAVMNKMMAGWQPTEHKFTNDIIDHIAVHELGHAVVGMMAKNHANVSKIIINLSSPKSPAYTVFKSSFGSIYTRESLFEHLMILLAGRIAEEVIYDFSITTGAINDFEEALKLAERMVLYYGMGKNVIYPTMSDKYKEMIDEEVFMLINDAYKMASIILRKNRRVLLEGAELLKQNKIMLPEELETLML
jgi:cell division protease FtsH